MSETLRAFHHTLTGRFERPVPWYKTRRSLSSLALLLWLLLSWLIAHQVLLSRTEKRVRHESIEVEHLAQKLHESIQKVVKQQHGFPQLVALNPDVIHALMQPVPESTSLTERRQRWTEIFASTNHYLSIAAHSLGPQVVYVLNAAGDCIAASNAQQTDSFIGTRFSERSYFKSAMAGQLGTQYAVGKVSNIAGLYFSAPIYHQGKIIGVVAVKLNLSSLASFIDQSDAFISDRYGVIVLAADQAIEMQTLADESVSHLDVESRQARYRHTKFAPLRIQSWHEPPLADVFYFPPEGEPFVLSNLYRVEDDVNVHVMQPVPELRQFSTERAQLFVLLSLVGTIMIGMVTWRWSVVKNRERIQHALRESEARFRNMADAAPALIWMSDANHQGIWYNKSWLEYTGCTMAQELGEGWMKRVHPDDLARCTVLDRQPALDARQRFEIEYRLRRANGDYGWVADTGTPYFDLHGDFQGYISYCWDINQRKNAEEQIRHLAFYDSLTHLPNRRLLNERLLHAVSISKRDHRYGALMFLDLDNFKPLNDRYGHGVGDLLLKEVAQRITACSREMDTVARFGGDEFVVILNGLNVQYTRAREEASHIVEKIRLTLAQPYSLTFTQDGEAKQVEHHCTASIGVMLFLDNSVKQKDIMRCADIAMYRAKEAGRNTFRFYE